MSAPALAPSRQRNHSAPHIAHYFCLVEEEEGEDRGLCGSPLQGREAKGDEVFCAVCTEMVNPHRAKCAPCRTRWGMK